MKRIGFIALQAMAVLLLSFMTVGCSKDEPVNVVANSKPTLAFNLSVADITIAGTRALTAENENQLKDVKLLLFNSGDKLVEMYTPSLKSGGTTSSVYTLEVDSASYGSAVLLANIGDRLDSVKLDDADDGKSELSKDSILSSLIVESGKWNTTPDSSGYMTIPIPMWGEVKDVTINKGANVTNVITFQMLRMLARINVFVKDSVSFTLEDVRLYNYYDKGAVVPAADSFVKSKYEVDSVTLLWERQNLKMPLISLIYMKLVKIKLH